MERRQLGRTDLRITPIGFGAWAIGGEWRFGWGPQDDADSIAAITQAVSRGVNWIDTAPAYGLGHSEDVVARALADIPSSERPYVFTKCSLVWGEDRVVTHDVSATSIRREVEESLRRLRVETIDLYQIHWPRWHSQPEPSPGSVTEAWTTLADLKAQGKVRHIGVSNFTVEDLQTAEAIAPVESLQPPYSMLRRAIEAEILPYCEATNIGVLAYSPMLSGLLTGTMTRERIEALPAGDWRRNNREFQEPQLTANLALVDVLRAIGARHGRSAGEVAIAWTLRHPVVTAAIVGGRSAAQVDGVVGAADFRLSADELAEIEGALPRGGPMIDERLSIVDIFKIGVGPSSSHTLGPWRAAQQCLARWTASPGLAGLQAIDVHLFGSLAKTGRGHGTDIAVVAGLLGADPEVCDMVDVHARVQRVLAAEAISLQGGDRVGLHVQFHPQEALPAHPNGMRFDGLWVDGRHIAITCYSVGGGFVVWEDGEGPARASVVLPFPVDRAEDLLRWCAETSLPISDVVLANEAAWRPEAETRAFVARVWQVMRECIYRGCHTPGSLPGGLNVRRRAADLDARLLGDTPGPKLGPGVPPGRSANQHAIDAWFAAIAAGGHGFGWTLDWVTAFALAVNEENACFGRVVTAPTNGAAGVVPAVLTYDVVFGREPVSAGRIVRFLLAASEVGCLFKKGATISAAMGGCQAEIGVSSAMAAAGLTEVNGGSPSQVLMAAEIAMEHHLGLTCDPVGGLVQIPCIERNTMGAIKAITASQLALGSDPANARVSLDAVIHTMWATAQDMSAKYKETADGGLALHIPLSLSEC